MEITYTTQQQQAIQTAIESTQDVRGVDYEWSTAIVERNGQPFAVFGSRAMQLLEFSEVDTGTHRFEYVPMIVEGRMLEQQPHEGRSGIAYLMRCTRFNGKELDNDKWTVTYLPTGWIYTRELELSNAEILRNIADEDEDGHPWITGGRPGYVA